LNKYPKAPRPLRVAHLMQYFAIGGLERMVERLSVASKSRGIESLVIAYLGDGPIRASLEEQGVRTLLLDSGPGLHPELILRLRSVLVREQIDVLHTHHVGPFVYGAPAAVLARCPRVHTEHSHELYDTMRRKLLGAAMSPLAEVVAVTPEISEFRKRFPGRCRVISNGVPLPSVEPSMRARGRALLGAGEDSFVVGCAARLSAEKNHSGLLDAFAQLIKDEPRSLLACAGDGPLADSLRLDAKRAGLSEHVRWLGLVEEMSHFYSALDVCVLNSTREGLPLCLLEAMSFGIPVVATDVGGVGELLADEAGILVPPQAPAILAGALMSIAAQPELAAKLARNGKARISQGYSIDHMVDHYVALYQEVAKRSATPAEVGSAPCA
jgi:glycosyltransferase involved in cell wall biosynthesis